MLLKSYLVSPRPGWRDELLHVLSLMPQCEVIPADNRDAFILLTSTATPEEDEQLEDAIASLNGFVNMSLVSGYCGEVLEDAHAHAHA